MSKCKSGANHPNYNKKLSSETKQKISEAQKGELHPSAKVKFADVQVIKSLYMTGNFTFDQLAIKYGVTNATISRIINNQTYKTEQQLNALKNKLSNRRVGEQHPSHKLKVADIPIIKEKYATGNFTYKQLAAQYNVSDRAIGRIVTNKTWTSVVL